MPVMPDSKIFPPKILASGGWMQIENILWPKLPLFVVFPCQTEGVTIFDRPIYLLFTHIFEAEGVGTLFISN